MLRAGAIRIRRTGVQVEGEPGISPAPLDTEPAPQPDATIPIPDRPAIAPSVQLIGEFEGSAFRQRQWLIERDGHFIQVPELLYRVAEYANSERTLDEIASLVTTSTDWTVTADQIRAIVAAKL